mmetsp:Transcript_32625/g.24097  ORF Transcript_32625/g.24097 Transcript_32625/m.24097 type:complete len:158 (-) Transcript_32625:45-518(-)
MASFRFETWENVITKHHLSKVSWTQAAKWAFFHKLAHNDVTIASIKQIDEDTVEIVKRRDINKNWLYFWGADQFGQYERVIINRKDQSTAIDRMDINWKVDAPFLGRRDLFYPEKSKENTLAFVRHDLWVSKIFKFHYQTWTLYSAWSYKRGFKSSQ